MRDGHDVFGMSELVWGQSLEASVLRESGLIMGQGLVKATCGYAYLGLPAPRRACLDAPSPLRC